MSKFYVMFALLVAGGLAMARADDPGPTPANQAHVDFYRSNLGHTGVSTEKLTPPLSLLWRHTTRFARNNPASPVTAAGIVYFVSGGYVYAVNAADGTTRWQYPGNGNGSTFFATTPALSGGFLYLTDDNGQAYKLDAATGGEKWKVKLGGAIRAAPIVSNNVVYLGTGSSHCYALNADSGQVLWDFPTSGAVTASPTMTGGLVVFASSDNSIYSVAARNGHKAWSEPFETDPSTVPVVYDGTQLYVTSGDTVYRLDPSTGTRRGQIKLPTSVLLPPTVSADTLYIITQSHMLYALTIGGLERWRVRLDTGAAAPPLLTGGLLLVATQAGVLNGYNAASGKLQWQYVMQASANDSQPEAPSTAINAAPIVADGTLYVTSDDGTLSAFRQDAPDNISPQVTGLIPAAGSTVASSVAVYGATLVDIGSGIDPATVTLKLDGQGEKQTAYHAGQSAVYSIPGGALSEGPHQVTVTATDWRGNATTQTWSFTVNDHPQDSTASGADAPGGASPNINPDMPNNPGTGGGNSGTGGGNPGAPPPPPPIAPF